MKQISQSAFLFSVIVMSAFGGKPIGTITSAEPFSIDGHSVNTPGVTSFPVVVGDTVSTSNGSAVLLFSEGSTLKLGTHSSIRIAGVDTKPRIVLLAGALDYKLTPGSALSVTNLDSEHKLAALPKVAQPATVASAAHVQPGLILYPGQKAAVPSPSEAKALSEVASATYVGADTATQGNWTGKYGADGQLIANDVTNPPPYANVSLIGNATSVPAPQSNDPRALQVASGSSARIVSTYNNNFKIDLNLTDGNTHKVSFYLFDFDGAGRAETISIIDSLSKTVLSTQTFSSFANGVYETWNISGHVQIQIVSTGAGSAIINGIFFDAFVGAAPSAGNTGAAPNSQTPLFANPKFLVPLAGAAAAGLAAGLLSLPAASRHL